MSEGIFEEGLYEQLLTDLLIDKIEGGVVDIEDVASNELADDLISAFVSEKISTHLSGLTAEKKIQFANKILAAVDSSDSVPALGKVTQLRSYYASKLSDQSTKRKRPVTPLREMALLTNAKGEPSMSSELSAELASADGVDIIMSFVKHSGLNLIYDEIKRLKNRNIPVRLVTTVYMGATDKSALDILVKDLGVQVKVDLDAKKTRLHAKAWLVKRRSGFSTAYVGSSNMSNAALTTGAEWNVRLTQVQSPIILEKFSVAFETYWAAQDYVTYDPEVNGTLVEEALNQANPTNDSDQWSILSGIEVRPHDYQQEMLEDLEVARKVHGYHKNLVVAATGTGKTVLAALDYKRIADDAGHLPTLLFVAHRKEILQQAKATFQQVLNDPSFGELFVDGKKPVQWKFVFASIQSLNSGVIAEFATSQFDHVIVDEFHRAEAPSYSKLFRHLEPKELLALTATPERHDGLDKIQREVFGGRIASELRLWDALDKELLTPFHYFGIGEDIDYKSITWSQGKYDAQQLSNLVTGNEVRNSRIWQEILKKVSNPLAMRGLAFCVSVEHSDSMARFFNDQGLSAVSVTGRTSSEERKKALQDLRLGSVQVITTVDVFNEGVDIRELDTLLMLRPTESPVVFLQQLGRGLRKTKNKESCLVLDFVGSHRAEYRLDKKYQALSGNSRGGILKNLEQGFPYLPSGTSIQLDDLARDQVLATIKAQVAPGKKQLISEIAAYGIKNLADYLKTAGRELFEVYRHGSWFELLREASLLPSRELSETERLLTRRISKFLHVDDAVRVQGYRNLLGGKSPAWGDSTDSEQRLKSMFFWNLWDDGKSVEGIEWTSIDQGIEALNEFPEFRQELDQLFEVQFDQIKTVGKHIAFRNFASPLLAHATYSRYELVGAIGWARLKSNSLHSKGVSRTPGASLEGVFWVEEEKLDLFLVTLEKGATFSPSTRFHDYAISPTTFRWETQSKTSQQSPVGKRYLSQPEHKTDVLIAMREHSSVNGMTQHFKLLGLADFVKATGSKPIKIDWELRIPMDPQTFKTAAAVKTA
jgi:superfamily II DNA or RNA helicase/HKD family nuclease